MGRRTLVELFFITAGLLVAWALTAAAGWAYPLGREAIRWCGLAAMAATIAMGLRPLRRAILADRAKR
jgi:uncharacterized membrane protein